ncbi:MAG: hypothetical protein WD989_02395 [Candidatus Paceibacterota bacterium]
MFTEHDYAVDRVPQEWAMPHSENGEELKEEDVELDEEEDEGKDEEEDDDEEEELDKNNQQQSW